MAIIKGFNKQEQVRCFIIFRRLANFHSDDCLDFVPMFGGILVRRLALFRNVVVGLNVKRFSVRWI